MVDFERLVLPNGLTVLLHQDKSTPLVAVNTLFRAGSKYDPPKGSGLAHLFEHLMFSGTPEVPDYDRPVQLAGGENNAFTNSDYTNYFCYGPAQNLETFVWLEADRLANLKISKKDFDIQQQVVVEELYESCLNIPYGDIWHHLLPRIFPGHPYAWPTIGINEEEIKSLTLDDALVFYKQHYHVGNAILSISGNFNTNEAKNLVQGYFSDFTAGPSVEQCFPHHDQRSGEMRIKVKGDVPVESFYLLFKMPGRNHEDYAALDLISDLMAMGRSSLLYRSLIKDKKILSNVDAYITGTLDAGLYIIEGQLAEGKDLAAAEKEIWEIIESVKQTEIEDMIMKKLKNTVENNLVFSEIGTLNKSMNLCYYELLGDVDVINTEAELYQKITPSDLQRVADHYFMKEKSTLLHYLPNQ